MNVTYSDRVRQQKDAFPLLEQATEFFEKEVLGRWVKADAAAWDCEENGDQLGRFTLRLSDKADSSVGSVDLEELRDPYRMRFRMRMLWDGFLAAKLDRTLEKLHQMPSGQSSDR
jgi:hypothetical protein